MLECFKNSVKACRNAVCEVKWEIPGKMMSCHPRGENMIESEDMVSFLDHVPKEAAYVKIKTSELRESLDAIACTLMKKEEREPNEVTGLFFKNLHAVCPTCCVWIPPKTISGVRMVSKFGPQNVMFTNYGAKCHLLDGRCVLDECTSRHLFLIWRGSESIRSQVIRHIDRIKEYAEREKEKTMITLLDELAQDTLLAFTTDTLWALQKNVCDTHVYLKRSFPIFTEPVSLVVWVSVIPYQREVARSVFPQGYETFLCQILAESGHARGDVSVAHWIRMGNSFFAGQHSESKIEWWLNLGLASKMSLPEHDKFRLLPNDLRD